ncbi:glycosyltransferase [uncultured Limosilactobacillus sp.]|uniref:glycosyltransferase n=1 Tax=uncultured Limosilactobacillus sp. TaxID=2837629 RepID=UPI0025FB3FB4|nr:glycosyltransferase [uncultured Limosilactobacillus sp.]
MEKVVAISTDQNYLTSVETLIKSLAYHNRDVKVYVINEDLPQEWFINLNQRLAPINVQVIDAKFDPALINGVKVTVDYLSKMTYARILIPQLIPEDRVLYLDADVIVDRNLDDLFNIDMQGHPVAAAKDYFGDFFNAGVLLMDNSQLRSTNFVNDLLERGKNAPSDNDQTLLNEQFKDNYLRLPGTYNVQVGGDLVTFWHHDQLDAYEQELKASQPYSIIHYTTGDKPWKTTTALRERKIWWSYRNLEYSEIINHSSLPNTEIPNKQGTLFTFTNDENVKCLAELAQALPQYEFNVAAYTLMGSKLIQMLKYPNIRLYPSMTQHTLQRMLNGTDAYLDINYGSKDDSLLQRFADRKLPLATFEDVATPNMKDNPDYHVFANGDLAGMVKFIQELNY